MADSIKGDRAGFLDAALRYARRGWCIIPTAGKRAAARWKQYQQARPDEHSLRQLFACPGITGLAVLMGSASGGLGCCDFDSLATYERWSATHRDLAATLPTVATARGRHVYFRGPHGFKDLGDGEYRGDSGHYTLLPPSIHPSGSLYSWLVPLPSGELPFIDPRQVGLWDETEQTEQSEQSEHPPPTTTLLPSALFHVIESTLPKGPGERNRKVFELARRLRAIPSLASADLAALRGIVEEWYRRALPFIRTKDFLETWADFVHAWERVKYPAGEGAIEVAFDRAAAVKPSAKAIQLYGDSPSMVLLASLCRELQALVGDAYFFLDVRTAGRLLKIPHLTAWRWLRVLVADGILMAGEKGSHANRRASRFRYVASSEALDFADNPTNHDGPYRERF